MVRTVPAVVNEKLRSGGKRKKPTCEQGNSQPWTEREIEMLRRIRRDNPNWSKNRVYEELKRIKGKCSYKSVAKYWNAGEDKTGLQGFRGRPVDNTLARNPAMYALIRSIVADSPEAELNEASSFIRRETGVFISVSNLCKIYALLKITKKKAAMIDWRRRTARCIESRVLVKGALDLIPIRSLVYNDECNFNYHCIVRNSGYAPSGLTPVISERVSEKRYTLAMGMNYRRITCYHIVDTSEEGFSGIHYGHFLNDFIQTTNETDVIYQDNVRFHRSENILNMFRDANRTYLFSAPYSPDLNPIENCFGWLKKRIRSYQREIGFHRYTIPDLIVRSIEDLNNNPHIIMGFVHGCKKEWGRDDPDDIFAARHRDRVL